MAAYGTGASQTNGKTPRRRHFDTLQVHAGYEPESAYGSRQVPIYNTSSYVFQSAEHGRQLFAGEAKGMVYSRVTNPTVAAFEGRIAALEGGVAAVGFASGEAAIGAAFLALVSEPGQNFVSGKRLFGGTYMQLTIMFKRMGIEMRFADETDLSSFEKLIDEKTRGIFVETITNPTQVVADLPRLAELAHRHQIPLMVDNTPGMGGACLRPFEHGVDIIVNSATKWISGHGTVIAGVVLDGNSFDWKASPKFQDFVRPMPGISNTTFIGRAPTGTFAAKVRLECLRELGPTMSPFTAQQLIIGLETLSLRAERHIYNAIRLAQWLEKHEKVEYVLHPCLPSHGSHELSKKLAPKGAGSLLSFGVRGGRAEAFKVLDGFKLASCLVNVGDAKTVCCHCATTTHSLLTKDEKRDTGILDNLIRVSVGIEYIDDIIADFEEALSLL